MGRQQFFPSDVRVTDHPTAYDSETLLRLSERMVGLATAFNRYREEQLSPGSVFDTWVQPSTAAGLSASGGLLLIDHDLGFPAHSVAVDNPTSQWLYVEPCNRVIPPYTLGWVLPVISGGAQNARVLSRTPPGLSALTAVAGEMAYVAWHEAHLRPSAGMSVQPAQVVAQQAVVAISTGANAVQNANLGGVAGRTAFLQKVMIMGLGATAATEVDATIVGTVSSQTIHIPVSVPAGVTVPLSPEPIVLDFGAAGIPVAAVGGTITCSLPAFGAGNTQEEIIAIGYLV